MTVKIQELRTQMQESVTNKSPLFKQKALPKKEIQEKQKSKYKSLEEQQN